MTGILGTMLGWGDNTAYQGLDNNRNMIGGLSQGLLTGMTPQTYIGPVNPNPTNPIATALGAAQTGAQQDQSLMQAKQQVASSVQALSQYPDLVAAVQSKSLTPKDAYNEMFRRMDAKNNQKAIDPASTATGRAQLADQYGLNPSEKGMYVLSGKLPPDFGAQSAPSNGMTVGINSTTGAPDPTQQAAFLATLNPSDATMVKNIINYQADPTKVLSLRNDERARVVALAQQADPTFDLSQYTARASAKRAYSTGQQGQTITAANTAIGHLAALSDEAGKLQNGGFTPWNAVVNTAKGATSNPDLANFNIDRQAVASELAKFFKGTGATDMTTTEEWLAKLDPNMGSDTLKSSIKNIVSDLMKSRLDEMRSQYGAAMGRPADFRFITPETANVLKSLGIDAGQIDPNAAASGSAGTDSSGAADPLGIR